MNHALTRRHFLASSVAAAGLSLTASAVLAQGRPVEIDLWHYQTSNVDALEAQVADFMAKNPDVRVVLHYKHQDNMGAEIQAASLAGRAPDVAQVISRIVLGLIANARPMAMEEAPGNGAFLSDIAPNFLDIGRYDGKVYLLPQSFGTLILYYNKDLFRAAGLDPEMAPRNWDEVRAAAKAITDKAGKPGLYILRSGRDIAPQTMMINAGAEILTADQSRTAFDTPTTAEAMQLWQDMAKVDGSLSTVTDKEGTAAFSAGGMGMLIRSVASLRGIIRETEGTFELGVGNYPVWKDQPRRTPNSGAGLMMFSRDEAKRAATFRFLAYMMAPETTNAWSISSGYLPVAPGAVDSPAIRAAAEAEPRWGVAIRQMEDLVSTARWPGDRATEMPIVMETMMENVWHGTAPAAQLVSAAAAEIDALIAQAR